MKIYVASSWFRTPRHSEVVKRLRAEGFDVFDYRDPSMSACFSWSQVCKKPRADMTQKDYLDAMESSTGRHAFAIDMKNLMEADAVLMVCPAGKNACLELGYAAGSGKATFILMDETTEPELMMMMTIGASKNLDSIVSDLHDYDFGLRRPLIDRVDRWLKKAVS